MLDGFLRHGTRATGGPISLFRQVLVNNVNLQLFFIGADYKIFFGKFYNTLLTDEDSLYLI
jgi:hypothetical protein